MKKGFICTLSLASALAGEFGSERLVQQVVDTILRQTASSKTDDVESPHVGAPKSCDHGSWTADEESKIILSGAGIQVRKVSLMLCINLGGVIDVD